MIACFELENGDEIRCIDQGLVFSPFVACEQTLVRADCEGINSLLHGGIKAQFDYSSCRFRVKAAAERVQKIIQ